VIPKIALQLFIEHEPNGKLIIIIIIIIIITIIITYMESRSRWPRGLRRMLRFWVRIPPGAWMSVVIVVCCHVEVSATSW